MTPEESVSNLPAIIIILIAMRIIAMPIGVVVFFLVRRMMPIVNLTTVSIWAGYVVGFVVLFFVLSTLLPLAWYDAASIALVISAVVVLYVSYLVKKVLWKPPEEVKADEGFRVFGENVRGRPKNLRKRKR